MRIPEVKKPSTQSSRRAKKGEPARGVNFSEHLSQASKISSETEVSSRNTAVTGINSILTVQEIIDQPEREERRQLAEWGNDILDSLDEIRHDLLIGAIPKERLETLAQRLRVRKASVSDPRLIDIINEIELRAEIELAKLSRNI